MTNHPIFFFIALLILGYGLFSRRAERSVITAPMVFVVVGLLVSYFHIEILSEGPKAGIVQVLAELTLMLVLFIDASTIDRAKLRLDRSLPLRLLGIGLPITMVIGALLAIPLFPEEKVLPLILMAFILSPANDQRRERAERWHCPSAHPGLPGHFIGRSG
jgi:sodium/hydrogen antiporter